MAVPPVGTPSLSLAHELLNLVPSIPLDPHSKPVALEVLSTDDLDLYYTTLTRRLAEVERENGLFESYLGRVAPGSIPAENETTEFLLKGMRQRSAKESRKKGRDKVTKEQEKISTLTSEQKAEIASRELEELKELLEQDKEDWERSVDTVKAEIEESKIRIAEMKKSMYEFKREIGQAVNERTSKVIAERVVRYYEDRLRQKDATIEKIRLKNSTLKVQRSKLLMQLKQKEEMGEVLHAIDFEQLKIENSQYLSRIEERNSELLGLKLTAGNTVQVLNVFKKKLGTLTAESDRLKSEIRTRKELGSKLAAETEEVIEDLKRAEQLNNHLRRQMEDYKVPQVLEYVAEKAGQEELVKKVRSWQRKVEIAEMALKRQKRLWKQIKAESKEKQDFSLPALVGTLA